MKDGSFFKGKRVAVTGGTDGIGKALVTQLIDLGAMVSTCGRNQDKLYRLQQMFVTQSFAPVVADVSKEADCKLFIEHTIAAFGGIDILINNAGISMRAEFKDLEVETIKQVMDINFYGTVYTTYAALPYLMQSKGTVVGVSSIAGYRGLPGRTGYSSSKFALNGFLECMRTEMMHHDVHVMWVCPGFTSSNIRQVALNKTGEPQGESPMNEGKMMSADTCATYILKAIANKKRTLVLTGQGKLTVWLNRLLPAFTDKLVHKFFYRDGKLVQ